MADKVQFYFSFRSPYSWLAMHRISLLREKLPVELHLTPVLPPRGKENFMLSDKNKVRYIIKDVNRIATAYGLDVKWPESFDTDWLAVHIAYIYAAEQGKGIPFCLAVYHARFVEGKDVGDEMIMREISLACGLDADTLIEAQTKRQYKRTLLQGMASAGEKGVFGVPFFVYKDSIYWGNDRLEWLLREINDNFGTLLPDLTVDPFRRPY
ncbi:MAG: 2-hydroxychromene-2-carboxylate isomerase [Gammaproteobacteria bacterium]